MTESGNGIVTLTKPYNSKTTSNSDLLSILKPFPYVSKKDESITHDHSVVSGIQVPILKTSNISEILHSNDSRIFQRGTTSFVPLINAANNTDQNTSIHNDLTNVSNEDDDGMEIDSEIKSYCDIESFIPKNLKEQVNTISIKRFPNVKKSSIERIISILLEHCDISGASKSFQWTIINDEPIEYRLLHIRFAGIDHLQWFLKNAIPVLTKISPDISIVTDPVAEQYIKDSTSENKEEEKDIDFSKEINQIRRILNSGKNYETTNNKSGTEDLDQVMKYYDTYKVEDSELVDIPKDMKEKIVKEVIKFRSRMLTIEKNRRKREIERERLKAKNRLKQIFEGIKEANNNNTNDTNPTEGNIEVDEINEDEAIDELEEMNEDEYQDYLKAKEDERLEKEYEDKLSKFKLTQEAEKNKLQEKLNTVENYENNLIENKFLYIEEIKNFEDFNLESFSSSTTNSLKNLRYRLYYDNHSEYMKLRNQEKQEEEEKDKLDYELEQKETSNQPSSISIKQPIVDEKEDQRVKERDAKSIENNDNDDIIIDNENKNENEIIETKTSIEDLTKTTDLKSIKISQFSQDKLTLINDKISDLIEEYLGIKEEILIKFIYDFLIEKNLNFKNELIDELDETLDEDSIVVANELWEFIINLHQN